MSLAKLFNRIFFHNNTTPALNEDNLNAMSKAIDDIDDRVIGLAGTIMEDVPQIQEDIADLQEAEATFNAAIQSAQDAATNAQNSANAAAGSVTSAQQKALIAEGWAKGTQNGSPVSQSSPYWENNAEYYANEARHFTPEGYQDLVDEVDDVKQTLSDLTDTVSDSEAYVLRQGLGNLADMELVGGSLAWNQLIQNGNFASTSGWNVGTNTTFTVSNNVGKLVPIDVSNQNQKFIRINKSIPANHKVFITADLYGNYKCTIAGYNGTFTRAGIIEEITLSNSRTRYGYVINNSGDIANIGLYFNNSTEVNVANFMFIDLTALFGSSTIADYIYSLEQATEGAGVAWFRKYFPNAYYAYQSGKIESVNVASRKVVGFNQWDEEWESGAIDPNTGEYTSSSGYIRSKNYIHVMPNENYYITNGGTQYSLRYYDGNKNLIGYKGTSPTGGNLTIGANVCYIKIVLVTSVYNNDFCINISKTTGTPKNGDYVPYSGAEYPFANKQLRGIPKLVDNKLSYDGDIWKADGSITRKYGVITLDGNAITNYGFHDFWESASDNSKYMGRTQVNVGNKYATPNVLPNIISDKFVTRNQGDYSVPNVTISPSLDNAIYIYFGADSGLDTTAKQIAWLAQNPVTIVYELATPTTESATPFQNPQRAFIDGTEEFVDYGVQSATRDVSIPVGNNTTYQLNETLPPIEDYVDGAVQFKAAISALGTDESGRTTASRAYTTGEFFYKDGKMYKVLTSIAQGATFTINTNCQQTTLFAELKALA